MTQEREQSPVADRPESGGAERQAETAFMTHWRNGVGLVREFLAMPHVTVELMYGEAARNEAFFQRLTREFYAETQRRHSKFPLIRNWAYGVAVCVLPPTFDDYFLGIESAARRNFKKAQRMGYRFERIRHNDHLADMHEIHASAEVRQGQMPGALLHGEVKPCDDPPSRTRVHDYPYFGVLKDGRLTAYSGVFVCGEAFMIEQLYGHAAHHPNGVVPMLLIGMVDHLKREYPNVKYYINEMYFGAGPTMRRFKRKFRFEPHRVHWVLG